MSSVFEKPYAHQYDALYGEKDYSAECDAIESLFRRHGSGPIHTILDLGCGTGTHALLLAERGYAVTGIDRSPAMLGLARAKAMNGAARPGVVAPDFLEGDIRTLKLGRTFDAVVMLFAVLGYQTSDADVTATMRTVAAHLRPGGLFVCDVWFGPAVLAIGTSDRHKVIEEPQATLHRTSSGRIDEASHTCRVDFKTWRAADGRITDESAEQHTMRFFFRPELDQFFREAKLDVLAVCPFDDLGGSPSPESWNIWICGRAR